MLKVRLEPITLMLPVIDNSGEHDCKMPEEQYEAIRRVVNALMAELPQGSEVVRHGVSRNAVAYVSESLNLKEILDNRPGKIIPHPPVSQVDPVIDTTVRDSEMRSSVPEMSLEELRERPERTRTPPRPRANSWRHNE